jgi:hypothetical protein
MFSRRVVDFVRMDGREDDCPRLTRHPGSARCLITVLMTFFFRILSPWLFFLLWQRKLLLLAESLIAVNRARPLNRNESPKPESDRVT